MTASNQIIQTLEYLFEKFGIAVNWSTEAVLPAIQTLMNRYAKYEIVYSSFWIGLTLLVLLIFAFILKRIFADYKDPKKAETTPFWLVYYNGSEWEPTILTQIIIGVAIASCFISIVIFICNVTNIISWVYIPEIEFAKVVSNLTKGIM